MAVRIAIGFACVDVAAGGEAAGFISADVMRRAIRVTEWFKNEARRLYGTLAESTEDRDRRQLMEWIDRQGGSVTVRELTHGIRQYRGRTEAARAVLDDLEKEGYGQWSQPAPGRKGGRPSPRFNLVTSVTVTETPDSDPVSGGFGSGDSGDADETTDGETPPADDADDDWGTL